ncbi:MAG: (2Fe-2S)-binding protein [Bryobacteraceae bacterium]|nr:(2Fe-2S)-binding protein [Bryobacteraceae bacterium]
MPLVTLTVNGAPRTARVPAGASLLEFLHDGLGLSGVRLGCEDGVCGACTVLVDGRAVRACTITAASCAGRRIVTLEGLSSGGRLHPLQEAFLRHGALRCGFCTPGMILEAAALLDDPRAQVTRRRLRQIVESHVCHCGMKARILEAVEDAAIRMGRLK